MSILRFTDAGVHFVGVLEIMFARFIERDYYLLVDGRDI